MNEVCLSSRESGLEIGGLLLGWIEEYYPLLVRIEDFEEVSCEHRYGPSYILSDADRVTLRKLLRGRAAKDSSQVVGFFRTYCDREPALDEFDEELFRTYFLNRTDLLLLLKPVSANHCLATFRFGYESPAKPLPHLFSFYESATDESTALVEEDEVVRETLRVLHSQGVPSASVVGPATMLPPSSFGTLTSLEAAKTTQNKRPWLIGVACALVAAAGYLAWIGGNGWQVVPLSRPAKPVNVTTAAAPLPASPAPAKQAEPGSSPTSKTPSPALPASVTAVAVPPAVRHQVQPEIPAGVRARIADRIVIPVRVRVSSTGRVISAVPESGSAEDGLVNYLSKRAAKAALLWRFAPAKTKGGIPVLAEQTISFVFTAE